MKHNKLQFTFDYMDGWSGGAAAVVVGVCRKLVVIIGKLAGNCQLHR